MVKLSGRLVSALLVLCLNPAAFAAQEQTEPATANSELSQAASPTDDSLTTNDNAATQQADSQDAETETDRNVADATEAAYPESPETSNQDALEQPIPSLTEEESQQDEEQPQQDDQNEDKEDTSDDQDENPQDSDAEQTEAAQAELSAEDVEDMETYMIPEKFVTMPDCERRGFIRALRWVAEEVDNDLR